MIIQNFCEVFTFRAVELGRDLPLSLLICKNQRLAILAITLSIVELLISRVPTRYRTKISHSQAFAEVSVAPTPSNLSNPLSKHRRHPLTVPPS